jgi:HAD superfamily hydrolase (TIGR01458 family)
MGILLDIDGTLLDAGRAIQGAPEAVAQLRRRGLRLLFATNTSRKSRADVGESLRREGIDAKDDEVLSASWAAAVWLRELGIRRVQLLLSAASRADWAGFETTDASPEAVVLGDMGRELSFDALNSGFRSLRGGARLVATHTNRCWKNDEGEWALDAGAFVAALEYAAQVEAEVVGKPAPGFFRMAAAMLQEKLESLVIVGDSLELDIAGGRACGLATYLVLTGSTDARQLADLPAERRPHHVLESVRDLPEMLARA